MGVGAADAEATPRPRRRRWPFVLGSIATVILVGIVVVAILFRWDWFLPMTERWASSTFGRRITAQHMHVQLGRVTRITFDDVHVANPDGWPGGGDFATAPHLIVAVDAMTLLRKRRYVIPTLAFDHPNVDAEQLEDGRSNWGLKFGSGSGKSSLKIGEIQIADGTAHVVDPKLRADFQLAVNTKEQQGADPKLHATAKGTYAGQPITGEFTGGALLTLRDTAHPYPVNLQLANGPTKISLIGTVQDPLSFQGADLKLILQGPDMRLLYPFTGIPIAQTPPYKITGNLDYQAGRVRFTDFEGATGRTDLSGDLSVTVGTGKPAVEANLVSRQVDLQDLAGFIGDTPGRPDEPGMTPQQRAELHRAEASGKLIRDTPIALPKLNAADVHVKYKVEHIRGRGQPLDDMRLEADIENGNVKLHPLNFAISDGKIASQIALDEEKGGLHARADVTFDHVSVDKLLTSSGAGHGAGTISGRGVIEGAGRSLAAILGHGSGEVKLYMGRGGNLSALLVDLSGLEFGNALLSLLGIPQRATIECLIADAKLQNGVVRPQPLVLDTTEALINVTGEANLLTEALAMQLKTEAKHFTIGSLPAPINIRGTLKHPSAAPDAGTMAVRGGIAVALGIVATPLAALLPTIQFGTGETNTCSALGRVESAPHIPPRAAPAQRRVKHCRQRQR